MLAVILCIYINDSLPFVKESIESLFNQTYSDLDIYIQYDGVIQNNIDEYLTSLDDNRLHIFKRKENRGLAISLNELLTQILEKEYEFIARMDADDISMPERLTKQVGFMTAYPEIDCLGTWAIEIDANGIEYFRKQMPVTHEECLNFFQKRDCLIHPSVMFRRSFFNKAGLYPEDTYFGEDTMMWAKGFQNGCIFGNLPEYLLKFRLNEHFFDRRRGYKHAKSIFDLRCKVNKMLGFGMKAKIYAYLYAIAKMMPEYILKWIYKKAR
jgi:glycosyltransferase involved in cell wall biosynthesis